MIGDRRPVGAERAGVANLAAGFAVEGRLVQHDLNVVARLRVGELAVADKGKNLALGGLGVVAEEFGRAEALGEVEPDRLVGRLAGAGPGGARLSPLLGHGRIKAGDIHATALLAQRVLGQVEREAVGVVEPEGGIAGQRRALGQARRARRRGASGRGRASP